MSKIYILHNNNSEKLLTNCQKNNCPINYTTYIFFLFQTNLFIFQIPY